MPRNTRKPKRQPAAAPASLPSKRRDRKPVSRPRKGTRQLPCRGGGAPLAGPTAVAEPPNLRTQVLAVFHERWTLALPPGRRGCRDSLREAMEFVDSESYADAFNVMERIYWALEAICMGPVGVSLLLWSYRHLPPRRLVETLIAECELLAKQEAAK